jgi:F-type H+-transporting ATPase subunit gamma
MPSLIDIRRRIRSVKSTQQLTKAMKMIAAARLRRAQERMMAARPYAAGMRKVLASVAARAEASKHPLLEPRESEKNVVLIVVTSDRGQCGAFNANILRSAQRVIAEHPWESVTIFPIGRKGTDFFKRRPYPLRGQPTNIYQALSLETVRKIAQVIIDGYLANEFDAIYVIYNEFKSMLAQRVTLQRLLPLERDWNQPETTETIDYLYAPSAEEILSDLLPKHIEFQLYRILLESAAAEQAARMTAMEAATKNASELIEHLTLTYNRIRQAKITKEIIEIVSGAAAASQ